MISLTNDKRMLAYEALNSYANVSHFVTTRQGGCSEGAFGSFNCSPYSGDKYNAVRQNQTALLDGMKHKPKELIIPRQSHELTSLVIDDSYFNHSLDMRWRLLNCVDALITDTPGYCICVSTADCVPVLLYDTANRVVAAVHAGWRGTVGHIVNRTLTHMNKCFGTQGKEVIACMGPSISLQSFEVGEEVYEAFQEDGYDMSRISTWNETTRKHHLDLWEANRMQLLDNGVAESNIEVSGICTYIHHQEFFSARRLGIESGRMLSGIMINE